MKIKEGYEGLVVALALGAIVIRLGSLRANPERRGL